jgi:ectoine hydroxylase-related dioxygenase (phytanoyl-CoA dioxygenase family)
MAALRRLRADDDPEAQIEDVATGLLPEVLSALADDGGIIVENLLGTGPAGRILDELADDYDRTAAGSRSGSELWETFHGRNTVRFTGLAARSRAFVDHALLNPMLLAVADALLLPHGADYWLNTGQVMAVGPGEPAQYLHRDENNWPEAVADGKELTVSCMFALSDFTVANGATVVLPGTQRLPAGVRRGDDEPGGPGAAGPEPAYAEMPAGSGMIYTGKVVHGAGANTTDAMRHGMHVSFVVGWLRPEEASPLMIDRELAATLPARARQLLGWGSYHSNGGGRTWLVDFEDADRLFV